MSECTCCECQSKTKSPVKSKTNWVAALLVVLGMVQDPMFMKYFGDLIPPAYYGKIMFASGWVILFLRTFKTDSKVSLNWKSPWKD